MTDHYREAEQHLDFAAKSTGHPPTEQAHLDYAKAHGVLALIDQLSARPHVDLTGNPSRVSAPTFVDRTDDRIDMTTHADRAEGFERVLLDGVEHVIRKANADD